MRDEERQEAERGGRGGEGLSRRRRPTRQWAKEEMAEIGDGHRRGTKGAWRDIQIDGRQGPQDGGRGDGSEPGK